MPRPRCTAPVTLHALIVVLCFLFTLRAGADDDGVAVEETIDAIWRIQRFDFTYRSANVYYSCDALQTRIGAILKAVGAYPRIAIDIQCMGGAFVNYAFARVTLAMPTEATQENVRAATTFDNRARLIARLRKTRLPTATDIERFPATWQTVTLSRSSALRLEPSDCDLLRGMHEQVFPRLSIRGPQRRLRCASELATRTHPKLEVTALMPVQATPLTRTLN